MMQRLRHLAIAFLILGPGGSALALEDDVLLDPHAQTALEQTQLMLVNPASREKALADNPEAAKADLALREALGHDPAKIEKAYQLSSKVFGRMVRGSGGDEKKLIEQANKAAKNPQNAAGAWSAEEQGMLRELARQPASKPLP